MKKPNLLPFLFLFSFPFFLAAQPVWHPIECSLPTAWSDSVSVNHPWPEYPRPQMVRDAWMNLNGLWDYGIRLRYQEKPWKWDGQIRVPFPVESCLSGVHRSVTANQVIWYHRVFTVPEKWNGKRILLHLEASDWETKVWVNERFVGIHQGGYDPFTLDITDYLAEEKEQDLLISVWDPTDKETQPRGKQVSNPRGIWYTSTSGIWQTVWLEPVSASWLTSYRVYPDVDRKSLDIRFTFAHPGPDDKVEVTVFYKGKALITAKAEGKGELNNIPLSEVHLWTPEHPDLYDLEIKYGNRNGIFDEVKGYFGLRKVSLGKDRRGVMRILLNNRFVFQNGPLDQGFWPDGIYTPPTEEAMKYDLEMIKKMGFNMLRKHVKVESRRYYYWCDRMGILVWQDMPGGDRYIGPKDPDIVRSEYSARQYKQELAQMITTKFNHPSIIMWVAFNEGWGQFDTPAIVDYIRSLDPTRLVDATSGWSDRGVGDVLDVHHYPNPIAPEAQEDRAIVLGEYGGLGLSVPDHTWVKKNWGYIKMKGVEDLQKKYQSFFNQILIYKIKPGLSACVYTQTTDVETETNGLMTYDRKVVKMNPEFLKKINKKAYKN